MLFYEYKTNNITITLIFSVKEMSEYKWKQYKSRDNSLITGKLVKLFYIIEFMHYNILYYKCNYLLSKLNSQMKVYPFPIPTC